MKRIAATASLALLLAAGVAIPLRAQQQPAQQPVPVPPPAAPTAPAVSPGSGPAQPGATTATVPPGVVIRPAPPAIPVVLDAGSGRLIQLPAPASTMLAADPRIARVQPASPTSLFVMAVSPGRTTVVATAEDGTPVAEYDVTVRPGRGAAVVQTPAQGLAALLGAERGPGAAAPLSPGQVQAAIRSNLRGVEGVRVGGAGPNGIVLNGTVATAGDAQRVESIARALAGQDREVINNLQLLSSIQVNVRVRVAEISRQITRELGFNWQAIGTIGEFAIGLRSGPASFRVPDAIAAGLGSSLAAPARVAAGLIGNRYDINAVIDALAADQLITILAEPNLTAQSGEVASFLAGGEFPVPVNASANSSAITIEFKQFGVSLAFVPTVLGPERLNLRVRPEVSELTEEGSVSIPIAGGSIRIPALRVRRAETTVELGSGQSFAIAGLLSRSITQVDSGLAGLGELPVLGPLFRSDRFRRAETELVIIVTPYLVRPVSDPRALAAPTDGFRPATDIDRLIYYRQIARGAPPTAIRGTPDAGFILE